MGKWGWVKYVAMAYTGYKIFQHYRKINYLNIAEKITPNDQYIINLANEIISRHRGPYSIEQLLDIFDYMKNLQYIEDPNPYETLLPKDTLIMGKGDCDEFAVATASLIGAIGGTVRVVTLFNNKIGHAFCEVHMGEEGCILENYLPFLSRYDNYPIGWEIDNQNHEWLSFDTLLPVPGCIHTDFAIIGENKWNWKPSTKVRYFPWSPHYNA
jgi:transglutaminase-like putative cysteine protease